MSGPYYVYILTNFTNSVLYSGVTNDLARRVYEHREKLSPGIIARYAVWKLVHYEVADEIASAIEREKQIKAGPRSRKVALMEKTNPGWRDLYWEIL